MSGAGAWAHLALSTLAARPPAGIPAGPARLVLVRRDEAALEDLADALEALSALFPVGVAKAALFGEDPQDRIAALERLRSGARVVLASPASLASAVPGEAEYEASRLTVSRGLLPRARLLERLASAGYRRTDFVEGPCEYAARGAVVDFFTPEPPLAVRVLYDGDSIESLRPFDPQNQAAGPRTLESATLVPAREQGPGGPLAGRLAGAAWLVEEGCEAPGAAGPALALPSSVGLELGYSPCPSFAGSIEAAARQCLSWREKGFKTLLFSLNRGEDERIQELLEDRFPEGTVQFLIGPLREGFVSAKDSLAVLTTAELLGRSWRRARSWRAPSAGRSRLRWGDLRKGDYVVHEEFGVGRYLGMEAVAAGEGSEQDCLKLEYRGGDALYVPMTSFRQVQKYVGAEGHRPRLSSLDSRSWSEVKDRVKEGVRELAEQLIKVQAARAAIPGHVFGGRGRMEEEFARSFPFEETPDQRKAIEEVEADMAAGRPMDRIVVGDVGFGKTEVALRAAFKCAAGLKQTALLVPTTILADQHLRTFRRRLAGFPVRVEMLSRFSTKAEQKAALEALASGKADIVIGTHRLLSGDVRFRDLGLMIIDEEHRFGVRDKERMKALKKDVHCLTLSATPIPRTLQQGLAGLRSVSLIRSAPSGRQPVETLVRPWDPAHAAQAILEELARGGQVFFVHNRVRSLPARVESLKKLLPGVRVGMAHGQMRADQLEKTMWEFFNRKYDVLAASSIIESGLDIPSVNTLLIENAQDFGLAQLYQLRGRIGRERQKAYCHLYYPSSAGELKDLSEDAKKRLQALREFGELGSGLALALRDLEIRGAGDLLGPKQHGFLNAVGVDFYCEMLETEIARLKGRAPEKAPEPAQLDLSLPAYLPHDYLPGDLERIEFYKRMLAADADRLAALKRELTDLSGPPPAPVENLFRLMGVRAQATAVGAAAVVQRGQVVEVRLKPEAKVPPEAVARWMREHGDRLAFLRSEEGEGFRVRLDRTKDPLAWIEEFLGSLSD